MAKINTGRVIHVHADGTEQENGDRLYAAIQNANSNSSNPVIIQLAVGNYNMEESSGGAGILMDQGMTIRGMGRNATTVQVPPIGQPKNFDCSSSANKATCGALVGDNYGFGKPQDFYPAQVSRKRQTQDYSSTTVDRRSMGPAISARSKCA